MGESSVGGAVEVAWRPAGASAADWPGLCFGGRLHATDQADQTAARDALSLATARAGKLAEARGCRMAPCGGQLGLESRLLCVLAAGRDVRVDRPGRTKRVRRR
jgi:hypothetical protein